MNIENHPCFNDKIRHQFGRVHLPVAPKCNIQCNYCDRKFDCQNENRPGVSSAILTPKQALVYLDKIIAKNPQISVVGIAGPGDPFANPDETLDTLNLIRDKYPDIMLCLATNGLGILPYIDKLAELKVSHVTITINSINPEASAKIYAWARDNKIIYRGIEAANLLISRQLEAITKLKAKNIIVKINTIIIPDINDFHILEVADKVKSLGADIINCIPIHPTKDTVFENIQEPSHDMIFKIRSEVKKIIPQMHHCTRCRADAVGFIDEQMTTSDFALLNACKDMPINPEDNRPYVAVASMEGILINQHLGEADSVWIYKNIDDKPVFLEKRIAPVAGAGDKRWLDFADILKDCKSILVSGAGSNPQNIFMDKGIKVIITEGIIEDTLQEYFNGKEIRNYKKIRSGCGKGIDCSGNGTGCG